jgi:hypothetical protein
VISHLLDELPYEPLEPKDVTLPRRQRPGGYEEPDHSSLFIPSQF